MEKAQYTNKIIVTFISLLIIGCSDNGISIPPDISIQELLSTPDTITVENRKMYLTTYMWRDFQPISPENGKPLIAIVYVTAVDTSQISENISADAIWIIYNGQVWKSLFSKENIPSEVLKPNQVGKIAREGPKWGPNIFVEVIVRVTDGKGGSQLLRGSNQYIGRTD